MPANSNSTGRNQRNNPYLIEGWAVDFHRSKSRHRLAMAHRTDPHRRPAHRLLPARSGHHHPVGAPHRGRPHHGGTGHPGPAPVPQAPRLVPDLPHRLQRVCYEGRLHTRAGRLPLILWIRPTKVGERAHILCRAGICADDFDACKAEIGAGCYAREARIIRGKKYRTS